jgi:hypothetical protein
LDFTPSRVELSTAGCRVVPKNDATFEFDIPLTEKLGIDTVLLPFSNIKKDGANNYFDDGSYALSINYKEENWGLKI